MTHVHVLNIGQLNTLRGLCHLLALPIPKPDKLLARLRQQNPPVIARLQDERVVLDPRSVLPEQEAEALLDGLKRALEATG